MLRLIEKTAATAAMGGRTARVCDSCLHKRARWFCAADDAFLCQSCDASVHSANQLASRHDRIRLETTSSFDKSDHLPPWLNGFTRKARTPRATNKSQTKPNSNNSNHSINSVFSLVPEIGNDDGFLIDDNPDEHGQFLHHHHHQVPVFDPFDDEDLLLTDELEDFGDGFLPSEVDLAEFVLDVENLLGRQQEEEGDENGGLLKVVKDEDDELLMEADCINNNNYLKEEEIKMEENEEELLKIKNKKKKNIFLRLDYDAIITAWDEQSSPYTTGNRPRFFDLDDCLDEWVLDKNGETGGSGRRSGEWKNDGEREARVSRYREKRRRRLFSKKIRYQVRKLNAEKRPRMKGRFVKRITTQH